MRKSRRAFSLVEVAVAVGILGFVILTVVGLLSVGLKNNQVSVEETRAALMLTLLEADLRNSHPSLKAGNSALFHLKLPYANGTNGYIFNPDVSTGDFYTTGVDDSEQPLDLSTDRPRYQASVTYLEIPPAGSLRPMVARLAINWPATNTSNPTDVINPGKVRGSVETIVTFSAP